MAKEEDLKKVDLKVSVNCCEGCRRKVLKALSIKGVLKVEIHPTLPKITVTGNVDVQTLIKKLAKSGKFVELWASDTPVIPEKEEKQSESKIKEKSTETSNEKDKAKEKSTETSKEKDKAKGSNVDNQEIAPKKNKVKFKEHEEDEIGSKKVDEATKIIPDQDTKSCSHETVVTTIPQVNCLVNPGIMPPYVQGYYPMPQLQPITPPVPMPYYVMNMNAYSASPPFCVHDHCHCQLPAINPPPVQLQNATGFADYFNDDNTVGCSVM